MSSGIWQPLFAASMCQITFFVRNSLYCHILHPIFSILLQWGIFYHIVGDICWPQPITVLKSVTGREPCPQSPSPGKQSCYHDDTIAWKHFPYFWLLVQEIYFSVEYSPHKRLLMRIFDIFFIKLLNNMIKLPVIRDTMTRMFRQCNVGR